MRLPSKDSAVWRAILTGLQSFVGFNAALLAMPEFQKLVMQYYPQALPAVVFGAAFASLLVNWVRKDVQNY